jgi:uncharacterized SAM-binding protein YcdF (DUF218 family)
LSRTLKFGLICAGATGVAFAIGFAVFAATILRYDSTGPAVGDAVVVLTGGELRVREGFKLFTAGAGRRILISGVHRGTTKLELQRLSGVTPILFDCCVDVDYAARDTVGNAAETRAWLQTWGFRRLVVVTSNYHMPRSLLELKRSLPGVELVPHAVTSTNYQANQWWRRPAAVKLVMTEYIKFWPSAARWSMSVVRAKLAPRSPSISPTILPAPEFSAPPPRMTGL